MGNVVKHLMILSGANIQEKENIDSRVETRFYTS
jgi:hypothetical protein